MSLSIGIVGLPNVGKSTLFNALTGSNILAANYPFATIEPNTGIVPVPDPRLDKLSAMYGNAPIKPATVTFVDIAGLVAGASQGEGLGNQFLANIRTCNAIVQVVRAFADPNVVHVSDPNTQAPGSSGVQGAAEQRTEPYMKYGEGAAEATTPQSAESTSSAAGSAGRQAGAARCLRDIEVINTELVLADLQTITNRLPKLQKEAKADPKLKPLETALVQIQHILDGGQPLFASSELSALSSQLQQLQLQLLTAKPIIYVFNIDENDLSKDAKKRELAALVAPARSIVVCAKLEAELHALDPADAAEMLASYGQHESGLIQLIHAAYDTLGLQSYLTAGNKEVRAWTIPKGATAPQAAGVIHGDFERGFIAAQIVDYDDLVAAGSEAAAKAAGKVRTEGKDYVMQPGDVVEFRFNVSK